MTSGDHPFLLGWTISTGYSPANNPTFHKDEKTSTADEYSEIASRSTRALTKHKSSVVLSNL